jgi:hypothetical protein
MSHFGESKERSTYRKERRKNKKGNKSKERGLRGGGGETVVQSTHHLFAFFFVWEETISLLSALFPVFDWITVAKSLTEPSVYIQQ